MKRILPVLTIFFGIINCNAWNLTLSVGDFFTSEGVLIQEPINYALVVDTTGNGFDEFALKNGDKFIETEFINSTSGYLTLVQGVTTSPNNDGYYDVSDSFSIDSADHGLNETGGELIAFVAWTSSQDSNTVFTGDKYVFINPSNVPYAPSDKWVVPANEGRVTLALSYESEDFAPDPSVAIPNEVFYLDETVAIPEPSTYAAILGAVAMGFALIRRKR